ncbi:putative intracellular protein transport-like protein [Rosellinia necatrix]|uniref:Putative intracellular protein transport-like protein n=1 Tax=Rosellinia necatrix TaxID=77044 RepID=A0A1W2TBB2_ROSNE|nr:putative intracellular protein transport-like protein [Rosellinia necatrix]
MAAAAAAAATAHDQHHHDHQHRHHPSLSALSETSSASSRASLFPSFVDPSPPPLAPQNRPPAQSVSSSRNTKGLVLNDRTSAPVTQPIRRKPLSSAASSIATRYSSGEHLAGVVKNLPRPEQRYDRSFSVDSPIVYEFPQAQLEPMSRPPRWDSTAKPLQPTTPAVGDGLVIDHDEEKSPENHHPRTSASGNTHPTGIAAEANHPGLRDSHPAALDQTLSHTDQQTLYDDLLVEEDEDPLSDNNILDGYNSDSSDNTNSNPLNDNMSLHISRKTIPQHLTLKADQPSLARTNSLDIKTPNTDKPLPKSPSSSRLGTFFGWTASPTTDTSEKAYSPLPSPFNFSKSGSQTDASPITTVGPQSSFDVGKTQFDTSDSRDYCESYLATPSISPPDRAEIDEMEDELKAISAELAASIRREIDLEDMVERLQAEKENPTSGSKRTSDYFSDSGYSSVAKFGEYDQSREEIERIQRRSEQERAQLRLELTTKLQDERLRRQKMDEQIKDLSAKASQMDLAATTSADASDRVKELEATCENLRRKLSEERQVKDNFEDLLSALKAELQDASNERDNLRNTMVPQLQARVNDLQNQTSELEKAAYESTKMQQELRILRSENSSLKQVQMDSISEEGVATRTPLSRSNSLGGSRSSLLLNRRPPSGYFGPPKTVKTPESSSQLSECLKDVEEQRDALHRALKNLLERQEHQNRENQRKIRALEMERDRLLTASPQKAGFQREISNLRSEITVLRRRAEEALDQKWQVEKGLAGLKMDLDKAEQEVEYLRKLLADKDILIPPAFARLSSGSDQFAAPVTSESLMSAYHDLQNAYADSLERIKNLEASTMGDEKSQAAMQKLETALSSAVSERNLAQHEVESYKEQLASLKASEQVYLASEKALADELQESARRVEELAIQVQRQLSTNQQLRQRIADTVTRGDASRAANVQQITSMQARLRSLEEKLEAAQAASEDRVARHEEEMSALKESHNTQLTRLRDGLRSPRIFPAKSPVSPLFTAPGGPSPRLSVTRSGPAMNVSEETQIDNLKARVAELENALSDADAEMQQVVGRMNIAQIEVLELQEEREAAINQTRKLERELQTEKVKAFEERFKTFLS